jgi:cytochrome c
MSDEEIAFASHNRSRRREPLQGVSMKPIIAAVVVASFTLTVAQTAAATEALAKSNGCLNCHAVEGKKVGPAFKDIAAKHKKDAKAADELTAKLKSGKGHPAVKASDDDLKSIVAWILAM